MNLIAVEKDWVRLSLHIWRYNILTFLQVVVISGDVENFTQRTFRDLYWVVSVLLTFRSRPQFSDAAN